MRSLGRAAQDIDSVKAHGLWRRAMSRPRMVVDRWHMIGAHDNDLVAARRRAGVVAAIAGVVLAPYFWVASATLGWPGWDAPAPGASGESFIDFYLQGRGRIPLVATVAIGSWAIWLTLVVSVVRAACRRFDLAAILAVTMAGGSTAVFVAAEGLLAWPTVGLSAEEIPLVLDPGVAQAMVLSRDGLHAAASVLLGIAMVLVSWLLVRCDLWGHRVLAAVAFLAAIAAVAAMVVGPEGLGPGGVMLWGLVVSVVILLGRRRAANQR
jgi:hypothetical protein